MLGSGTEFESGKGGGSSGFSFTGTKSMLGAALLSTTMSVGGGAGLRYSVSLEVWGNGCSSDWGKTAGAW